MLVPARTQEPDTGSGQSASVNPFLVGRLLSLSLVCPFLSTLDLFLCTPSLVLQMHQATRLFFGQPNACLQFFPNYHAFQLVYGHEAAPDVYGVKAAVTTTS